MKWLHSRAIFLWTIVSLMMVLHFFLLLSVGVITTQVRGALDLTALELSFLSSSYLYIYIILQTPAGVLIDCYGAKKLLTAGGIVCGLGCWMFAHSTDLTTGMIGRILTGCGLSFVFISTIQLANRWFPQKYFGMMVGLSEAAGMIGAIVSNMLMAIYITQIGWRDSFAFAGVFSIVLALAAWLIVRDYPKSKVPVAKQKLTKERIIKNMRFIYKEPQIWLSSAYVFLMYTAITVFSGLWANPFLREAYGMTLPQATFACCLVLAGIGIGSPIMGAVSGNIKRRVFLIKACPTAMLFFMCLALYVQLPSYNVVYFVMFMMGFSGSILIQSFTIVAEVAPEGVKSTAVGVANTLSLLSAIMFQPVVGWILNISSDVTGPEGLEYYSARDYRVALSVLPVCILLTIWVGTKVSKRLIESAELNNAREGA